MEVCEIMSIIAEFEKLTKAKISKLYLEGEVVAYRVGIYDIKERKFTLNDFYVDLIEDSEILKFLMLNTSLIGKTSLMLVNGAYVTNEELQNNVAVRELEDRKVAEELLRKVIRIIQFNQLRNQQ